MIDWPELPDSGVYLNWPSEGTDWIHPDDVAVVEHWIPSDRVFHRIGFDGTYYQLQYGDAAVRVKPTLWLKVNDEGFRIGDQVEVKGIELEREPIIARILEIRYDAALGSIYYLLEHRELPLARRYRAEEMNLLTRRSELREPTPETVLEPPKNLDAGEWKLEPPA
ncbi:hypothetical protein VN12_09195 [Pirellula sp. SH-Sr6A]|uniref:DUF6960 family protein n=1 Tax=Pirellula sp. SH-Sr6A TaxID=1632865 RepID=UPI00078DEA99|nr:hypothetical protein [Pirellula sp. SH-Sr6A]AMV32286.1 hypothetical protein VN12_09195 [Pirellula sp. SH-Sr6A]